MRKGCPSDRGFSLLELLIVVATGVVLTAISVLAVQQAVPEARANAALRLVKGLLVYAREEALSERRSKSNTNTARATTLFGSTGRVMGYRWNGRTWVQM
ncbi:MAG: prepilin-type N-terminal cleavage/methylation domain-containing protein [Acidobacteria bacterium]|nr:prepilin-type N-terminal cleavage/methylation domain-containing protein [Acidobacteriota bacterium]